jgi:hypothetical protein
VEHAQQRLVLVQRQRVAHEHHRLAAPHPEQRQPVEPTSKKIHSGQQLPAVAVATTTDLFPP